MTHHQVNIFKMYFNQFNRYYSDSCRPGCSYRHPARHPSVLPHEGKEEITTAPTCARQHRPGQLGGQRASGLQQHHQAHLTPRSSPLTPPSRRWMTPAAGAVSYRWTNSDWWERKQCPLTKFEMLAGDLFLFCPHMDAVCKGDVRRRQSVFNSEMWCLMIWLLTCF